jgi:hypothetical protein
MTSPGIQSIGGCTDGRLIFVKQNTSLSRTKRWTAMPISTGRKAWRKKKRPVREAPGEAPLLDARDDQERDILLLV